VNDNSLVNDANVSTVNALTHNPQNFFLCYYELFFWLSYCYV